MGATIDYINITPFFYYLSIFWNNPDLSIVILALSSTTIKSLQTNSG